MRIKISNASYYALLMMGLPEPVQKHLRTCHEHPNDCLLCHLVANWCEKKLW